MTPRCATALFIVLLVACAAAAEAPPPIGRHVRARVSAIDDPDWRGIVGDALTLSDLAGSGSCRVSGIDFAAGRYRIERPGDEIRFLVLRDECGGRRSVLLSHPLRRVS